jgi:hypothetical protein
MPIFQCAAMNRRSLLTALFTLLLLAVAAPVVLAELSNEEILKRAKSVANSAQPHPLPETIFVTFPHGRQKAMMQSIPAWVQDIAYMVGGG